MEKLLQCNVCKSKDTIVTKKGLYCKNCGSNFANYIPDDNEISEYYKKNYENFLSGGRHTNKKQRAKKRALYYLNLVEKYKNNHRTLLDIGCSNSPFPNLAFSRDFVVEVCDFERPKHLSGGIPYHSIAIDSKEWFANIVKKYDILSMFDVIEHCRYPHQAVINLSNSITEDGIIVLTTPLSDSFSDRNAMGTTSWLFPPEHLNIFSKKGMELLFSQHNFELIYFEKFEYTPLRKILRNLYGLRFGLIGYFYKVISRNKWETSKLKATNRVQDIGLYIFRKKLEG